MRRVKPKMLTDNMILGRSLVKSGKIFLRAGAMNLNKYIHPIEQLGITGVYVEDVSSEGIVIHDIISEEMRTETKQKLFEVYNSFLSKGLVNLLPILKSADSIVETIYYAQPVSLCLSDMDSLGDITINHCINTAVYTGIICREMGMDRATAQKVVLGAMLIDIGIGKMNPKTLMKKDGWTQQELNEYKQHPLVGYEALKKCLEITELTKNIVQTHHEYIDGSGFPKRMHKDHLTDAARIVAVASRFDELVTGTIYGEKAHPICKAVELLTEESSSKLDSSITALLLKRIAIYPNGCMVQLSNNQVGIVKEQNPSMPYRPIVRLMLHDEGRGDYYRDMDLMKELSLTITHAEIELERAIAG